MISVLIPCFNREKYIQESIESILNQSYKDLDIIVYDDGSNDNSIEIINWLQEKDSRIRLIQGHINRGEGFARNRLLDACSTEIACWQDSDDISLSDRIELQIKEMNNCDMVFTAWNWLGFNGEKWIRKDRASNHLASPTIMFKVNNLRFDEKLKISGADWDFINRYNHSKKIEINKVLYLLRNHDDRMGILKNKFRVKFTPDEMCNLSFSQMRDLVK